MKSGFFRFALGAPHLLSLLLAVVFTCLSPGLIQAQESSQQSEKVSEETLDRLIQELQSSDKDRRREAALRLSELGPLAAPAAPQLIEALADSDQQVWFFSVTAIAKIGPAAEAAIPTLIEGLEANRRFGDQVWYRHSFALGKIGPAAIPAIQEGMKDRSSKVRSGCIKALSWIGAPANALIPEIITALEDESGRVRQQAAETLGEFGSDCVPLLIERLQSNPPELEDSISAFAEALFWIGGPAIDAEDILRSWAESTRSDSVRAVAVKALDRIQPLDPTEWASFLTKLLTQVDPGENPKLEQELRNAILLIRNPALTVLPELEKLTLGDSRMVAEKAATTLGEYFEEALPAAPTLIQAIEHWDSAQEDSVFVQSLAKLGSGVVPAILEPLKTAPIEALGANHWALRTLKQIRPTRDLVLTLAESMDEGSDSSQLAALATLSQWAPELQEESKWSEALQAPVRAALLSALSSEEPKVRTAAWSLTPSMAWPGDEARTALAERLAESLKGDDQGTRLAALTSVQDIDLNIEATLPVLLELLDSKDPETQILTAQVLGDLGQSVNELAMGRLTEKLDEFLKAETCINPGLETWGKALMHSLAQISLPEQSNKLISQLAPLSQSDRPVVSAAALEALGDLGPQSVPVVPTLLEKTLAPNREVRLAAYQALTRVTRQSRTVVPALTAGIQDEDQEIRIYATEQIGKFGREAQGPAEPLLFAVLDDSEVRKSALDTLRQIRTEALPLLITALDHEDASVRLFACETLGFLGPRAEKAIPALEKRLRDDYSFVRQQAEAAIKKIQP